MDDRWFNTKCGRRVLLEGVHIRTFDHGFLEGRPELVRKYVLAELPKTAEKIFPGASGLFIEPLDGPADRYPAFTYFCNFVCDSPVGPHADCSSLTVCWFADGISEPLPEFIAARLSTIDWAMHARDGFW